MKGMWVGEILILHILDQIKFLEKMVLLIKFEE